MRTREEIQTLNNKWEEWAIKKNLGNPSTVQQSLQLEVLLDIRDLLANPPIINVEAPALHAPEVKERFTEEELLQLIKERNG